MLRKTKNFFAKNFEMKDMGESSYMIGIEIFHDRSHGVLGLSHKGYIERILDKFNMDKCLVEIISIQKGDI